MPTRVNQAGASISSGNQISTSAFAVTAGNMIDVFFGHEDNPWPNFLVVSDTAGNTYTEVIRRTVGNNSVQQVRFRCFNALAHASNVVNIKFWNDAGFTNPASLSFARIISVQYSSANQQDGTAIAGDLANGTGDTQPTAGNYTTSQAASVIGIAVKGYAGVTYAANANWAVVLQQDESAYGERFVTPGTYSTAGINSSASVQQWSETAIAWAAVSGGITSGLRRGAGRKRRFFPAY